MRRRCWPRCCCSSYCNPRLCPAGRRSNGNPSIGQPSGSPALAAWQAPRCTARGVVTCQYSMLSRPSCTRTSGGVGSSETSASALPPLALAAVALLSASVSSPAASVVGLKAPLSAHTQRASASSQSSSASVGTRRSGRLPSAGTRSRARERERETHTQQSGDGHEELGARDGRRERKRSALVTTG